MWPIPPLSKVSDDQDRYELELNFQVPDWAQWPLVMKIHNVTQFMNPDSSTWQYSSGYTMENEVRPASKPRDLCLISRGSSLVPRPYSEARMVCSLVRQLYLGFSTSDGDFYETIVNSIGIHAAALRPAD